VPVFRWETSSNLMGPCPDLAFYGKTRYEQCKGSAKFQNVQNMLYTIENKQKHIQIAASDLSNYIIFHRLPNHASYFMYKRRLLIHELELSKLTLAAKARYRPSSPLSCSRIQKNSDESLPSARESFGPDQRQIKFISGMGTSGVQVNRSRQQRFTVGARKARWILST
jgi:hypothetical protein